MTVWTVVVFENGDMTTKVWGVFDSEEKANAYKDELMSNTELDSDGYYLEVTVSEHKVQ